jgi:hypothetical protein
MTKLECQTLDPGYQDVNGVVRKIECAANEHVNSQHACVACANGLYNMAGDDAAGPATVCDGGNKCATDQHVESGVCVACPSGTSNAAGDDALGPDTQCIATQCSAIGAISSLGNNPGGVVAVAAANGPPACTDNIQLAALSSCGLECKAGYSGKPSSLTCPPEGGHTIGVPECEKNTCDAYIFSKGIIADASNSNPCTNGISLTVLDHPNGCDLKCDVGYGGPTTSTITCPASGEFNSNGGGVTVAGIPTCTENLCPVFSFTGANAGIAGDGSATQCTDGVQLSAHNHKSCGAACATGYWGQAGTLKCSMQGTLSGAPSCTENVCAPLAQPGGPGSNTYPVSVEQDPTATTPCTPGIALTAVTSPSCGLKCTADHWGQPFDLTCPSGGGAYWGIQGACTKCTLQTGCTTLGSQCLSTGNAQTDKSMECAQVTPGYEVLPSGIVGEVQCTAYTFSTGMAGDIASSTPLCTDGILLSAVSNKNCALGCTAGYSKSGDGILTCNNAGGAPTTTTVCTEIQCNAFTGFNGNAVGFMAGVQAGVTDGCTVNQVLTAISDTTCSLKCKKNYVNSVTVAADLTCPITGGDPTTTMVACQPIKIKTPASVKLTGLDANALPTGFHANFKTATENKLNAGGGGTVTVKAPKAKRTSW